MGSGVAKQTVSPKYDYKASLAVVSQYVSQEAKDFERKWQNPVQNIATFEDFLLFQTLGTGAFGRVLLVQHKSSKHYYAMKALDKSKIAKMRQVEHLLNEKKILQAINFPFFVKLQSSFKDNCYCYLVLEFVSGGEMFTYLRKVGQFSEQQSKLYAAQVVLAFHYLHTLNILYRDLKPENILIDKEGFLKVTDLGFAKRVQGRTYTLCGTPEYMAPEIILNKGYGKGVDWWTLGILIFEMVAGYPPFSANEHLSIYEKIYAGKYKFPKHFSEELKDLCQNLIQADLTRRYGILKNEVEDIKHHSWFQSINWVAVFEKKVVPYYIPKCKGPGDHRNFHKFDEEKLNKSPSDKHTDLFKDF